MSSNLLPQSHEPNTIGPAAGYGLPAPGRMETPLSRHLGLARRKFWMILSVVTVGTGLTYGVCSLFTPLYEATATVDVDVRMPSGVLGSESRQVSAPDTDQFMATQIKLIQSDAVLRPVAQQYDLLHLEKQDRDLADSPEARKLAPVKLKRLTVNRPPSTFLLQVSYRSPNPQLSADVANAIANSYVQHTYNLRLQTAEGLSNFMERQLEQLKAKMETSSDKLATFERTYSAADPEQRTAVISSQLVQLNNEYATAEGDRLRKEAAYNSVRNGSMEAAEVSTQGEALKQAVDRLDAAEQRFTVVKGKFGAKYPEYKTAELEVQNLQRQVDATRASIAKRVEIEYKQASNREAMLSTAVTDLKKKFDALNAHSFEYQTLKRDAEADKRLYDELVGKIKEAGINAGFQNSSMRIADGARPALKPSFPNMPMNVGLAFCFSLCAALALAVLSDDRDAAFSNSDQARTALNIAVLGTLPYVKGGGRSLAPFIEDAKPILAAHDSGTMGRLMYEEAIYSLCSTVMLTPSDRKLRSLVVTSALPGEGKTLTACHLAVANARRRRRTLLMDCDFRLPGVDLNCGLHAERGLEEVLEGKAKWRDIRRTAAGLPELDILPVRQSKPELVPLIGRVLPAIIAEAKEEYDLIVIDSPPILRLSDPLELAALVDGVLLLAVAGQTNRKLVFDCVGVLRQLGVRHLGLVLNKVSPDDPDQAYYNKYTRYYRRYLGGKSA
jgi:succinoglycan biosynthesis transport protein ExoP